MMGHVGDKTADFQLKWERLQAPDCGPCPDLDQEVLPETECVVMDGDAPKINQRYGHTIAISTEAHQDPLLECFHNILF